MNRRRRSSGPTRSASSTPAPAPLTASSRQPTQPAVISRLSSYKHSGVQFSGQQDFKVFTSLLKFTCSHPSFQHMQCVKLFRAALWLSKPKPEPSWRQ